MHAKHSNDLDRPPVPLFESSAGGRAIATETCAQRCMNSAWQRFCRLSSLERSMFLCGIILLPATAFALRFTGIHNIETLLNARPEQNSVQTKTADREWWLAQSGRRMVEAASRYGIVRGNCLSKSIVLWHLLRRQGVEARLHVGARKDGAAFEAHAWVELDGQPINESSDVRKRFGTFESHADGV